MQNVLITPSLSHLSFLLDGKELGKEIAKLKFGEKGTFSINMTLSGLNDFSRLSGIPNFINFCVYESNYSNGKGYRILEFYTVHLPLMMMNSPYIDLSFDLLNIDENFKPMERGFEGDISTPIFDFEKAFVSLKVFYSYEDFSNVENIDNIFYDLKNVILNTKLPLKQVIK